MSSAVCEDPASGKIVVPKEHYDNVKLFFKQYVDSLTTETSPFSDGVKSRGNAMMTLVASLDPCTSPTSTS